MFARTCHSFDPHQCDAAPRPRRTAGKLRPASQSYLALVHGERLVLMTIAGVCGVLIYAGVWLIRLLG
jgi:hypothetical protein